MQEVTCPDDNICRNMNSYIELADFGKHVQSERSKNIVETNFVNTNCEANSSDVGNNPSEKMDEDKCEKAVILNQPILTLQVSYGHSPLNLDCPYCHNHVTSATSKSCGALAWIICGIICLVGLILPLVWLGFCLILFCIPSLYDTEHTCPSCKRLLGKHSSSKGL